MKIALANTYHYVRGGASLYMFRLKKLLKSEGHSIVHIAMEHPETISDDDPVYFVPNVDYPELLTMGVGRGGWRALPRALWSERARGVMDELLRRERPDILHLQNFLHHLTASIVEPARKMGLPVLWSLHDFTLVCPNANLFDDRRAMRCDMCTNQFKRTFIPPLRRCKKSSFVASLAASIESTFLYIYGLHKRIDLFLSPSIFLIDKFASMGMKTDRFVHIPNFVESANDISIEDNGYLLYVGRLERYKGVSDLLRLMASHREIRLKIVGSGTMESIWRKDAPDNVEFTGYISPDSMGELFSAARAVIVPSRCFENAPLALLDAYAHGKAVIGARLGGIPELIDDGETGLLFESGNIKSLEQAILAIWNNPARAAEMGDAAYRLAKMKYSPQAHWHRLKELYEKIGVL